VAGFLIQNTLKYLLNFGQVTPYLGYNAMVDFFSTMSLKPNPDCDDYFCRKQQKAFAVKEAERLRLEALNKKDEPEAEEEELHAENEWGISLVDDDQPAEPAAQPKADLPVGLHAAFEREKPAEVVEDDAGDDEDGPSLEELMKQMKQI
jgi:ubiquitin-like modifier-activating enzyme 5